MSAYTWDLKRQAALPKENEIGNAREPDQGRWRSANDQFLTPNRGRFLSVTESRDLQGARIFLVDYGTGAKTIEYKDPRIVL